MDNSFPDIPLKAEGKLNKLLQEFNDKRKFAIKQAKIAGIVLFLTGLLVSFLIYVKSSSVISIMFTVGFSVVCYVVYYLTMKTFAREFKVKFFKQVLMETIPNVRYSNNSQVSPELLKRAGFFESYGVFDKYNRIESVKTDDQFSGERGNTSFIFSEIKAYHGKGSDSVNFFDGLFFVCDLKNKVKPLIISHHLAAYKKYLTTQNMD